MHTIKDDKVDDTFVSSINKQENYYKEKYTVCGKENCSEFKTLVKYDLSNIKRIVEIENNIEKIELCMFLVEIKLDNHIREMMVNIGENIEDFKCNTVTYDNAPKVKQKPCFYVLKPEFKNQYVNFNITNLVKEYKDCEENYGLSMLPISYGGIVFFGSSKSERKPYLKIYYKSDGNSCPPKNTCENIYGLFKNYTGEIENDENFNFIIWNKGYYLKGMEIDKNMSKIIIKDPGMYQIDCNINIKTDTSTFMGIFVNGKDVKYTQTFVGVTEQQINCQTLIHISEKCSILQVGLKKTKMALCNKDVASTLRIIKV